MLQVEGAPRLCAGRCLEVLASSTTLIDRWSRLHPLAPVCATPIRMRKSTLVCRSFSQYVGGGAGQFDREAEHRAGCAGLTHECHQG